MNGIEDAVQGMKVGETKTVTIPAQDVSGDEYTIKTVPLAEYQDTTTATYTKGDLTGKSEETLLNVQAEKLIGSLDIGAEKQISGATLKIVGITGDEATISIDNPEAIFYNRDLSVGLQ